MSSLIVEVPEARAQSVKLTSEALTVDLVDGRTIIVPLIWFPRLWHGNVQERRRFEVFGDGAALCNSTTSSARRAVPIHHATHGTEHEQS